jgi:phosphatidate cytidylyltransferase
MLLPRLITAIIGVPVVLLAIYWGGIPFFILMAGVVFLATNEYFYLAKTGGYASQPIVGLVTGMVVFLSIFLNSTSFGVKMVNNGTPLIISIAFIPIFAREILKINRQKVIESIAITFFGAFFVPWTLGHLVLLRSIRPAGMSCVLYLFIIIWMLDTGAYVVGKKIGKMKLAETVSPKKTVAGAVGGSATAVVVSIIMYFVFLKRYFSLPEIMALGLIISVLSQFSDLSESLLKRDVGVKDSADLLPGHGGMLDRFDSFLFTAPLFYYYLTIFKGY